MTCNIVAASTDDGQQVTFHWRGYDCLPELENMHKMLSGFGSRLISHEWEAEIVYPSTLRPVILLN